MSDNGGGNGGLYFIVGALVVVVAVLAFLFLGGHFGGEKKIDIKIESPKK